MTGRFFSLLLSLLLPLSAAGATHRVAAVEPPLGADQGPDYHLDGPPVQVGTRLLVARPRVVAGSPLTVPVAVVRAIHTEAGRTVARLVRRIPCAEAPFLVEATPMVGDEATVLPEIARLEIPGDILFAFDRAELRPEARAVLAPLAAPLAGDGDGGPIEIGGHTDSRGSNAYNQALSERRAAAVARFFTVHGVAANRLRAHGHGEDEPVADNATEQGRAHNRRVEIRLPVTTASR